MAYEYIEDFYNCEFNANGEDLVCNNTTATTIPYINENIGSRDKREHNLMELTTELHRIDQTPDSPKEEHVSSEIKGHIDEIEPSLSPMNQDTLSKSYNCPPPTIQKINIEHSTSLIRTRSRSNKRCEKNPLLLFHDNPNSSMKKAKVKDAQKKKPRKDPKKENYRIKCIRKWKKYLRKLGKNQKFKFMKNFKKHYQENRIELDKIASTKKDPKTKGKNSERKSKHKSYNNTYVERLFKKEGAKESFKLFIIDYYEAKKRFYGDAGNQGERWCNTLCQKFEFDCCKPVLHNKDCELKWLRLIEYTYGGLILNNEAQL